METNTLLTILTLLFMCICYGMGLRHGQMVQKEADEEYINELQAKLKDQKTQSYEHTS